MKCPKCNYIGFEPTDRCRNCGFDFSLAAAVVPAPDLPLRTDELAGPLADFDLGGAGRSRRPEAATRTVRRRSEATPESAPPNPAPSRTPDAGDLPLFGQDSRDDSPLVRPSTPTAPLSVRRSTPAAARPRPTPVPRGFDREPVPALPLEVSAPADGEASSAAHHPDAGEVAGMGRRAGAAALDWLVLVALDAAVVYFTLRVSRLPASEILLLPGAPLAAFLLLLNGGYLALFTAAGGQTIGKMAFGLKVVTPGKRHVTVGRALLRVVVLLVSALPAGLGLLPAVFDGARRGLHDRLAGTRVVRATAS